MIRSASWRCKAMAASGLRFQSCNGVFSILSCFRSKDHAGAIKLERAKVIVPIDILDDKASLFEQEFQFVALEQVEPCFHYGTLYLFSLSIAIIEVGQFQQMPAGGGCRANPMGQVSAIILQPGALVQQLPVQVLHIVRVSISYI